MGFKSRSFIFRQVGEGLLPQPIQIVEGSLRFLSTEIDAVITARIQGKCKADIQALVKQLEAERAKASMPVPSANGHDSLGGATLTNKTEKL